jgi:hypothetical protein
MSNFLRTAAAAVLLTALPLSVCAQSFRDLAPADEYFGHLKLSVLGIANMIHDADSRIAYDRARTEPEFNGTLAFVTDAIHAWEAKYPRDPWISKDLLALSRTYMHSGSEHGVQLARKTVAWLTHDYPGSRAARAAESELAQAGH